MDEAARRRLGAGRTDGVPNTARVTVSNSGDIYRHFIGSFCCGVSYWTE